MATVAEIFTRLEDVKRRGLELQDRIKDEKLRHYALFAGNIFRIAGNCLDPRYHAGARSPKAVQWMIDYADDLLTHGLAYVLSLEEDVAKDGSDVEPAAGRSRAARGRALGAERPKPPKRLRPSG